MLTMLLQSALEKIFLDAREFQPPYLRGSGLGGERFALQAVLDWDGWGNLPVTVTVDSPLRDHIRLYRVGQVPCQLPAYPAACDEDYLTTRPGLFPDPLFPLEDGAVEVSGFSHTTLWLEVTIPKGWPGGEVPITLTAQAGEERAQAVFTLTVVGADLPEQKLTYTQWFYADCIASYYGVPVYSQRHWELLEAYLKMAAEGGVNMILTPVLTPALDTAVGSERPCTQLAEIEKRGDRYRFDFARLDRFVDLALACGIKKFEVSHLFTQWGAEFAPAIYVTEDGERYRAFGWDTPADSPEYRGFLSQFLPALTAYWKGRGLQDRVVFHISDEPGEAHLDSYRRAKEGAAPYLEGFPIYDALSDYRFYEKGLVDHPIPSNDHIGPFLEHRVPGLWTYTCCAQNRKVGNRFFAMPSYRNRILGQQFYKFRIQGFLHWGYNFWYTQYSRGQIDPYQVTDAGRAFPGGDAFSVYPGPEGPIPSLRLKVFHQGLQDLRALELLESLDGPGAAAACIQDFEGMTFSRYPRSAQALLDTRERVNRAIAAALHK